MSNSERIKVLHCLYKVGSGGVERRRLNLAEGLSREKYEQLLLCSEVDGPLVDEFAKAGCQVINIGSLRHIFDLKAYLKALRVVRDFKPDIIHGAVYEGVALAAVAGRLGRVKIIIGEETTDPKRRSFKGHALYRLLCALTHKMVAVSPAVQDYLVRRIYNPEEKVLLINNGVKDIQPRGGERLAIRKKYGVAQDDFVIGTVGRLFEQPKRISDLIRAVASVSKFKSNVYLMVVGDGPDRKILEMLANDLGVKDRIIFAGYQLDTKPYYLSMDVFALVSEYEGLPLVAVEAMLSGLPVIGSNVGGTPFVVKDEVTGIVIEPKRVDQIVQSIERFFADPDLVREMGDKGRIRAKKYFSSERYLNEVDLLYSGFVSG